MQVDRTPPTGSVTINGGATYTKSPDVNLTLCAKDPGYPCLEDPAPYICSVPQMQFSSNGSNWSNWEDSNTARAYSLSTGDGLKTVYVRFKDGAGNYSQYSKTITLDTTAPAASITTPASNATVTTANTTITGTASDGTGSGVKQVDISTDGGSTWNTATGTTSWSYNWTVPDAGSHTIIGKTTDNIGNVASSAATRTVTAKSVLTANRSSIYLNCGSDWPSPSTEVTVSTSPWPVTVNTSCDHTWMQASAGQGGKYRLFTNTTGLATGSYSGNYSFTSPFGTNTLTVPFSVTITNKTAPELQHYDWDAYTTNGDCTACHTPSQAFLSADFKNKMEFCASCHNPSSPAHERPAMPGHPVLGNATSSGCKLPTFGNITGEYGNKMQANLSDGRITCITCHNSMRKGESYGRVWEYTTTTDNQTYFLNGGGWADYGYVRPLVYRDSSLWAGPTKSRQKKTYLVDPSEYTYNENEGSITFNSSQGSSTKIYVTLDYPYLRVSQEGNRMCSDCHTQATHKAANCLACHQAHNTANIKGVRNTVRTPDRVEFPVVFINRTGAGSFADGDATRDGICEVCHTQTAYYRRDGSGFTNHSGGFDYSRKDCTACHSHNSGFSR